MKNQASGNGEMEHPQVKILWTGGFDSSFRMVQLSRYPVTIQPYYLCDNRLSEQKELEAMAAITSDIQNHPETKCKILPLIKSKVSDIQPDKTITEAYQRLYKIFLIGSQYEWLSRFAKENQGLELCLEKSENCRTDHCFATNGALKQIGEGEITYSIVDIDKSNADLISLFGAFRFPLFEITKLEILEEYKRLGFEETMKKTWFCHKPINNEPCGICNPCQQVVEEGLSFRLSPSGLARYKADIRIKKYKWYRYYKKIRQKIKGY